jgi:hypothetical protein
LIAREAAHNSAVDHKCVPADACRGPVLTLRPDGVTATYFVRPPCQ